MSGLWLGHAFEKMAAAKSHDPCSGQAICGPMPHTCAPKGRRVERMHPGSMEECILSEPSGREAQDAMCHTTGRQSDSVLKDIDACLKSIYCYMLRIPRSCFPAAPCTVNS